MSEWQAWEDDVIRENWWHGWKACAVKLQGRTRSAIRFRASRLGVPGIAPQRKHLFAPSHCRKFEAFSEEWYAACNDAFVAKMREAYPERSAA